MKLKIYLLPFILVVLVALNGCVVDEIEYVEYEFIEEEIGAYSFGPISDYFSYHDIFKFEYSGEEVRIRYHVQGWARGIVSEFGWILFVDGLPQPTRLETLEGKLFKEENYLHEFGLGFEEKIEFYVIFTPVSGVIGQNVGVIGATILRPSFMPEGIERPYFEIFHSLSATLPAELLINEYVANDFEVYRNIDFAPISEEVFLELAELTGINERLELLKILEDHPFFTLIGNRDHSSIIYAENGNVKFELQIVGGQEMSSRITVFVNHKPILVNGVDFIEIKMMPGEMATIQIEVNFDETYELNSIYAIMVTTGDDFHMQDILKTRTLLLVNEQ